MSTFLKALQRAEEERLLQEQPWRPDEGQKRTTPPPEKMRPSSVPTERRIPLSFPSTKGVETLEHVDPHCVSLLQPSTFDAEQYRTLRYMVERAHQKGNLCVVALSSPASGDGKTLTAINLAGALAQTPDVRTLLIDTDLRQPTVARLLGLSAPTEVGLVDIVLDPQISLQEAVRPCPPFNLSVLLAGRSTSASYEVLKAERLGEILAEARRQYDYVVLDTPPLLPFPDCRLLGRWVDGFFIIVAAHQTPRKLVEEALQVVDPTQLLGLVFNRDNRPLSRYNTTGSTSLFPHDSQEEQRQRGTNRGEPALRRRLFKRKLVKPPLHHGE